MLYNLLRRIFENTITGLILTFYITITVFRNRFNVTSIKPGTV